MRHKAMWSEFVMSRVLERSQQVERVRAYDSPLSLLYQVADAALIVAMLWLISSFTGTPWSMKLLVTGSVAAAMFYAIGQTKALYRSWRADRIMTELWKVVEIWFFVAGISLVATYFQREPSGYPEPAMVLWLMLSPIPLIAWRTAMRLGLRLMRYSGINSRRLAIAGSGELARNVAHKVQLSPWTGLRLIGLFDDQSLEDEIEEGPGATRRRSLDALVALARAGEVDTVYLALPAGPNEQRIEEIMHRLSDSTVSVYLVRDRRSRSLDADGESSRQFTPSLHRVDVLQNISVDICGIKAVSVYESPFLGLERWVKRLEDIAVSSVALCLLAIPMLLIAIGVKLSSPGPVFFKQRRFGLDGKSIMVWKFRSMTVCEDGRKVVQASKNDVRVTRFGAFLRRTSLDELPQFINVLTGAMSIVGPRPHAISHNEYYRDRVGSYMLRHKVKPGITGWAQVHGFRGETETLEKMGRRVDFDLDYIRHWSLWLDIRIILQTMVSGFIHKNAY